MTDLDTHSTILHPRSIPKTFMVGTFKMYRHLTRYSRIAISLIARNTSCTMHGRIDRVFLKAITTLGEHTSRECGCQIGKSDDALWLALESWTRNETSHLVCGANITLWDTSKLTVLNHDTMCGPPQDYNVLTLSLRNLVLLFRYTVY